MGIGIRFWLDSTRARGGTLILALTAAALIAVPAASAEDGFGPGADVTRSEETGKVIFVGTEPGEPLPPAQGIGAGDPAASAALAYLDEHAQALGIAGDELKVLDASDSPGGTAVHTQQLVGGVPVIAGELIVNLTDTNEILSVSGEALPVGGFDTNPAVAADAAAERAIAAVSEDTTTPSEELDAGKPELQVYDPSLFGGNGGSILAWSVQIFSPEHADIGKQVLVDANSGNVAKVLELVHEALDRRVCDNANTRTATTSCTSPVLTEGGTYTGGVADVQPVYDFSGQTYNFYNTRWSRDGINGAGMPIRSTVRFCTNTTMPNPSPPPPTVFQDPCPYNNAFFAPFSPDATVSQAYYGQGVGSDDIVAHELTHGVTQFESNLVYQNESGAINESLSDVFGEALDLVNGQQTDTAVTRWQVGEDSSLGILRDMEHPPNNGDPDKMTSTNWWTAAADNGGVHTNSGVSNKAMFLLTDGQTFNTYTVTAIGLEKALRVYYEAQVDILTTGSDYGALANALRQACTNITGTNGIVAADCTQVNNAVLATEMDTEAAAPDTTINSGPGQTDDPTPTWTFSANKAGATFQCSVDQGTPSFSPCSGPGGSHTPAAPLADGNYTFRVRGSVGTNTDPTPATRDFTVSTSDMELVSKTDSQDPAFAGENLTYTIRARNNGAGTAENARVVDVLPNGVTYQSSSIPCTESPTGTLTCGLGNLADDQEVTFTITVSIARDLVHNNGSPLTITNTATADSDRNDRDASNDSKSENTLVKAKADLEIVSFAPDGPPAEMIVGQPATVTLEKVITNNGPSAPMDVRVARGAAATPNATVSPTSTSHVESAVGYQEQREVDEEFEIECTGGGPATFTFTNAIAPERPDDTDPDTSNNSAMTSFTVECIVPVAINIMPGSFRNPIELRNKKGEIPVAVLTTEAGEYGLPLAFDATQIRPLTARFGPKAVVTAGNGAPETHRKGHIEDAVERSDEATKDGDLDMLLHFATQKSQLTGTETEACVRGRFGPSNTVFQGCDTVNFVP
jgi:uncharacterized repeat protein (TIGR01451 family)